MPYFKRQPYAAMAATPATADAAPDVMSLAREILAADAAPGAEGPFRPRAPVAAGAPGRLTLDLALDDAGAPVAIRLMPGDLAGPGGRIPADALRVSPAALTLMPGAPMPVHVTIAVPPGTPAGRYAGLLAAEGDERLAIPIEVEVA